MFYGTKENANELWSIWPKNNDQTEVSNYLFARGSWVVVLLFSSRGAGRWPDLPGDEFHDVSASGPEGGSKTINNWTRNSEDDISSV